MAQWYSKSKEISSGNHDLNQSSSIKETHDAVKIPLINNNTRFPYSLTKILAPEDNSGMFGGLTKHAKPSDVFTKCTDRTSMVPPINPLKK